MGRRNSQGLVVSPTLLVSVVLSLVFAVPAFAQDTAQPAVTDTSAAAVVTAAADVVAAPATEVAAQPATAPATEVGNAKASPAKPLLAVKPKAKRRPNAKRRAKKQSQRRSAHRAQGNNQKIQICHATGSAKNPFVEIRVDLNGLNGHGDHADDIIPAPANGCPSVVTPPPGRITICHATGSATNPFVVITVSVNGLNGHGDHPNDIIPAPPGGCDAAPPPPPPPPPPTTPPPPPTVTPTPPQVTTTTTTTTTTPTPTPTPTVEPTATPPEEPPAAAEEPAAKKEAPTAAPAAKKLSQELPFTGISSGFVAALGALLLLVGFGLRRVTRTRVEPAVTLAGATSRAGPITGLRVGRLARAVDGASLLLRTPEESTGSAEGWAARLRVQRRRRRRL